MSISLEDFTLKKAIRFCVRMFFIGLIGWSLFFSENNLFKFIKIKQKNSQLKKELVHLHKSNQEFKSKIALINNDLSYVEKISREKYKFKKKDEVVIYFVDDKK